MFDNESTFLSALLVSLLFRGEKKKAKLIRIQPFHSLKIASLQEITSSIILLSLAGQVLDAIISV